MSQTNPASRTSLAYPEGDLSAHQLFALVDQHNALVEDAHDAAQLMDADVGITDVDYEAQLTAAEIDHSAYTTAVASPAPVKGLFGEFPVGVVSEELATKFTEEMNKAISDIDTIVAKLNADAGIVASNFNWSQWNNFRLLTRATAANVGVAQDGIKAIICIEEQGHGHGGFLLAAGTPDTGLAPTILRSTDDGRSWEALSALPATVTDVVAIVQRREKLFLFGNTAAAAVIYESTDYGWSWTLLDDGSSLTSTAYLHAIVTSQGTVLGAGDAAGEVYRSADGGSTWNIVSVVGPTGINALGEESGGKVMACGDDAILYSSSNDGVVFAAEEDFSAGNSDCRFFLELTNGYWAVTTQDGVGVDELQVSQDSGATWEAPVVIAAAVGAVDRMVEGPTGILYIAVGGNIQFSDDFGATVEAAVDGLDLPANDTAVATFGKNSKGEVLAGTTNTADFAGLWRVGTRANRAVDAFGDANVGAPAGPGAGEGPSGSWLARMRDEYEILLERWQALGAMMDDDVTIVTATYEAAFAGSILSVSRAVPERISHNVGHGASA